MSVRHMSFRCMVMLVLLASTHAAQARDLVDIFTSPFVDPLLTRPSLLDSGTVLPGDTAPYSCDNSSYDPSKPLTLADTVDLALCHNPQVASAWAGIKVQAAQVGEARAAYLPTISAGISQQDQKSQYPESQFQVNTERSSVSQYASLTWRLLDFGGRGANRRSANASLNAADFEIITGCGIGIYDGFIVTQAGVFPPCKWPAIWAFSTRPRMC